jgi:microcystin-dependent protein
MALWSWSKTAASNANADSTINWAEGQSPSSVNDSARAMMARIAEWRDDISGTIATGGTATAYTVASNQGFDTLAHMSGAVIAFVPHTTCGATVTLNVDGLGPRPLRSSPGVELPSGLLIQGTPYAATYNNADGAFYLRGFYSLPYAIPIGGLLPYVGSSAPNSSFALPFGQAISRSTYAALFALVGTTFGTGDGSTTFNLPDLRGRFVAGLDNMGGSAAGRITAAMTFNGSVLGNTGGSESHTITTNEMPSHNHTAADTGHAHEEGEVTTPNLAGGTTQLTLLKPAGVGSGNLTYSALANVTVGNTGGGAAMPMMPPAMVLPFIIRLI